ncbi:MAG TPA: hypothetical protein VMV15_05765 [Candidatus Binataceae bacterium]|nr:hypothetical protein [Candidatus Binataceae bacterium]
MVAAILSAIVTAIVAVAGAAEAQELSRQYRDYRAPDGTLIARVVAADKALSETDVESRIEIRSKDGKLIFSKDYSSDDGLHGLGVVKAQWTPDSQFFVYSMTSSGGHQPWYAPIDVYSRAHNRVARLDEMTGHRPTLSAAFDIIPPHSVEDACAKDAQHHDQDYVTIRIDLAKAFPMPTANR